MWKRIAQAVGGVLNKVPSRPPAGMAPTHPHLPTAAGNVGGAPQAASINAAKLYNSDKLAAAHQDLQDAVKELSQGEALPVSSPPLETLQHWASLPTEQLTLPQMEELARALFEGSNGLERDQTRAISLWKVAGEQGSIEGKYSRALCLKDGVGVERNATEGYELMLELAEKNDYHLAHYSLAVMLDRGEGVAASPERAFQHYRKAALGGVQPALQNMANAFAMGRGVKQSDKNALLYYEAAAEAGDPHACFTLGIWYYQGRGGLNPDPKRSFDLQLKAAQIGHPAAMFNVGTAFLTGDGVDKNLELAADWLHKAADHKIMEANLNLAKMYAEGVGVKQSFEGALAILEPVLHRSDVARELAAEIKAKQQASK